MTSVVYAPTFGHHLGLGLLKRGGERIGSRVRAYDPVRNGDVEVEVGPACRFDPSGGRACLSPFLPHGRHSQLLQRSATTVPADRSESLSPSFATCNWHL